MPCRWGLSASWGLQHFLPVWRLLKTATGGQCREGEMAFCGGEGNVTSFTTPRVTTIRTHYHVLVKVSRTNKRSIGKRSDLVIPGNDFAETEIVFKRRREPLKILVINLFLIYINLTYNIIIFECIYQFNFCYLPVLETLVDNFLLQRLQSISLLSHQLTTEN